MYPLITLIVILTLALVMARVATRALVHTGMSSEAARFQAWSALSGVGFTTQESESVVNHPVRRKLVMLLMLIGNVGLITVVSSFVLAFVQESGDGVGFLSKVLILISMLLVLWVLSASHWVDQHLKSGIDRALDHFSDITERDYVSLLDLANGYKVSEMFIDPDDWLDGLTLGASGLRKEGINVLGVRRANGQWSGEMTPQLLFHAGDTLVLYGRIETIQQLDRRKRGGSGDLEHDAAMRERRAALAEEEEELRALEESTNETGPA